MLEINTNISSLYSQKYLNDSTDKLNLTLERLASGYRINSAKDSPSGYAITEQMTATINALNQGMTNGNDGISMVQIASTAVSSLLNNVQQLSVLALAAQNGTLSVSQRSDLDVEFQSLISQMNSIVSTTSFNGMYLLNGTQGTINIALGADNKISVAMGSSLSSLVMLNAGDNVLTAGMTSAEASVLKANGSVQQSTVSTGNLQMGSSLSALSTGTSGADIISTYISANSASSYIAYGYVNTELALDIAAANFFSAAAANFDTNASGVAASVAFASTADAYAVAATKLSALASGLALGEGQLTVGSASTLFACASAANANASTLAEAAVLLTPISETGAVKAYNDTALDIPTLTTRAATYGAIQSNIQGTVDSNETLSIAMQAARSRAKDTDYTTETANLTKYSLLVDVGAQVLNKANLAPQIILKLLGN